MEALISLDEAKGLPVEALISFDEAKGLPAEALISFDEAKGLGLVLLSRDISQTEEYEPTLLQSLLEKHRMSDTELYDFPCIGSSTVWTSKQFLPSLTTPCCKESRWKLSVFGLTAGNHMEKVHPRPTPALWTVRVPPCSSVIPFATVKEWL